ncbi:MAG TPA: metallophosphoesterase family protein [Rhodothermales bacterium]
MTDHSGGSLRLAIISDIHANLEALQAVLTRIDQDGVDAVYCLGDVVGYGADPAACVDLVRERCAAVVLGNHDLAVATGDGAAYLPKDGQAAAAKHRMLLDPDQLDFLQGLPLTIAVGDCTFVHATPFEPEQWHRLGGYFHANVQFAHFKTDVCFVGHTHIPGMMSNSIGVSKMRRGARFIVNVGSVGQPRDGDPRASFCLFDAEAFSHEIVRVPYEVDRAARKIEDLGLPKTLAKRLHRGA